jgi:hypothetical protein
MKMQEGGETPPDQQTVEISREELRALAEAVFFSLLFSDGLRSHVKNCLGLSDYSFLSFFLST